VTDIYLLFTWYTLLFIPCPFPVIGNFLRPLSVETLVTLLLLQYSCYDPIIDGGIVTLHFTVVIFHLLVWCLRAFDCWLLFVALCSYCIYHWLCCRCITWPVFVDFISRYGDLPVSILLRYAGELRCGDSGSIVVVRMLIPLFTFGIGICSPRPTLLFLPVAFVVRLLIFTFYRIVALFVPLLLIALLVGWYRWHLLIDLHSDEFLYWYGDRCCLHLLENCCDSGGVPLLIPFLVPLRLLLLLFIWWLNYLMNTLHLSIRCDLNGYRHSCYRLWWLPVLPLTFILLITCRCCSALPLLLGLPDCLITFVPTDLLLHSTVMLLDYDDGAVGWLFGGCLMPFVVVVPFVYCLVRYYTFFAFVPGAIFYIWWSTRFVLLFCLVVEVLTVDLNDPSAVTLSVWDYLVTIVFWWRWYYRCYFWWFDLLFTFIYVDHCHYWCCVFWFRWLLRWLGPHDCYLRCCWYYGDYCTSLRFHRLLLLLVFTIDALVTTGWLWAMFLADYYLLLLLPSSWWFVDCCCWWCPVDGILPAFFDPSVSCYSHLFLYGIWRCCCWWCWWPFVILIGAWLLLFPLTYGMGFVRFCSLPHRWLIAGGDCVVYCTFWLHYSLCDYPVPYCATIHLSPGVHDLFPVRYSRVFSSLEYRCFRCCQWMVVALPHRYLVLITFTTTGAPSLPFIFYDC